jgi:hypothetical protein
MSNENLILIFYLILKLSAFEETSRECAKPSRMNYFNYEAHPSLENVTWSTLKNFKNFTDLLLDCNRTYNITPHVNMLPRNQMLIDVNFQLNSIFTLAQLALIGSLRLKNIIGIDINSAPFKSQTAILSVIFSRLNVYSNSMLLDERNNCNLDTYNTSAHFIDSFFGLTLINVKYPRVWCPYFFKNSQLVLIILKDITNSFLIKNQLTFHHLNTSKVALKHLISVQYVLTYVDLNKYNLSPDLFQRVRFLGIGGIVNGIERNLFQSFPNLKSIDMVAGNLREIFHAGNAWMTYLNVNLDKTMRVKFQHLTDWVSFDTVYDYPDRDLCLFKYFPHERHVYPVLVPGRKLECTCTLYWLQSRLHAYEPEINVVYSVYNLNDHHGDVSLRKAKNVFSFCDTTFNSNQCQLSYRFDLCQIENRTEEHRISLNYDDDIFYVIKFLEFILLVILQPCLCFIGIIHNVLTIITIRNKPMRHLFQESMYKHITINALFNIVYCVITILKLVNTCIFYDSNVFCSSVYQEVWAQNLKIFLIHFFGNVVKSCANFSYFMFSISRLWLITTKHSNNNNTNTIGVARSKSKNLKILIYILVLILTSCLLSSFKMFQYGINGEIDERKEFPYETRDEKYCFDVEHKWQCGLFSVFKIVNKSLNDVLFVILNVFLDLVLLKRFKDHIKRKLKQINDKAQHKLIEKSKKNLNRMIFFNSFIFVFSHLPEFTMTLLLIIYARRVGNFCNNKFSCDLLNEEVEFFGLISIVCQFYVFKIFDKNFSTSFAHLKSLLGNLIYRKKETMKIPLTLQENLELKNLKNLIGNGIKD